MIENDCEVLYYVLLLRKEGGILASDRGDLPWPKAEPAPGAPIWYLIEGDPVLGRGSFRVSHPGQLKAPHGLEVLDASRLPDVPLDATLSAALEAGRLTAVNIGRPGWESVLSQACGGGRSGSTSWPSGTWAPPSSPG